MKKWLPTSKKEIVKQERLFSWTILSTLLSSVDNFVTVATISISEILSNAGFGLLQKPISTEIYGGIC